MPQPNELLCIVNDTLPPKIYKDTTVLTYPIPFSFVNQNDVVVYTRTDNVDTILNNQAFDTSGTYTIDQGVNPSLVTFTQPPGGDELVITRMTDICNMLVVYEAGASIRAEDLNAANTQLLNLIQENYGRIKQLKEQFGELLTTPLYQTDPVQNESSWTNSRIPSGAAALAQLNATTSVEPLDAADYYDGKLWFQPSDTTQATSVDQPTFVNGSSVNLTPAWPGNDDLNSIPNVTQTYDFKSADPNKTGLRLSVNITNSQITLVSIVSGGQNWVIGDVAETDPIAVSNNNGNTGSIRLQVTVTNVDQGQSFFKIRTGNTWSTIAANDPASNPFVPLQTLYVNNLGSDTNSGRTPGTAFATIKKAVFECNKFKGTASTLTFATSGDVPVYNNTTSEANGIPAGHIRYTCLTPTGLNSGDIVTIPQSIWSCDLGNENYPINGATQFAVTIIPGEPNNLYIDVGPTPRVHTFVSVVSANPGENNEIPVRQGRVGDNFQIQVAPGSYAELLPIVIYAKNLCITGSSLRNTYVHPRIVDGTQPSGEAYNPVSLGTVTDDSGNEIEVFNTECRTMFYCDSGTYINNMTLCGIKAFYTRDSSGEVVRGGPGTIDPDPTYGLPAEQGWVAALRPSDDTLGTLVEGSVPSTYTNDIPGAFVSKSPYIQNCTNFSDINIDNGPAFNPQFLTGEGGDTSSGPTGGGILCDGRSPSIGSPLRSFVVDAFTQISLNGPGILCTNKGYSQLVSFFGTFCWYHAKALNGGQLNLSNCTTDFGQYGLIADQGSMEGLNPENDRVFAGQISADAAAATVPSNVQTVNIENFRWNPTAVEQDGIPPGSIELVVTLAVVPKEGQTLKIANVTLAAFDPTAPTDPDQGDPDPTGLGAYVGTKIQIPAFGEANTFVIDKVSVISGSTYTITVPYKQETVAFDTYTLDQDGNGAYKNTTTGGQTVYAGFIQDQNTGIGRIQSPVAGEGAGSPSIFISVNNLGQASDLWQQPRQPEPGPTQVIRINHNVSGEIIPVYYPILTASKTSLPGQSPTFDLEIYSPYNAFDRRNLGLVYPVTTGDTCDFFLQSYISTGGHTFEFVGSGTDYDSHPDLGGEGNPANQVVELGGVLAPGNATLAKREQINNITKFNQGRVWQSSTDEVGTFQVGETFKVDQKTGLISIDPSVIVAPKVEITEDLDMNQWAITTSFGTDTNILIAPKGEGGLLIQANGPDRPGEGKSNRPIIGPVRERSDTNDWDVVTQEDVGYDANQVPISGWLGASAFMDRAQEIQLTETLPIPANVISFKLVGTDLVITLNDGTGTPKTYTLTQDP